MATVIGTMALAESVDAIKKRLVTAQDINQLRGCFYALEEVAQKSILSKTKQVEACRRELEETKAQLSEVTKLSDFQRDQIERGKVMIYQDMPSKTWTQEMPLLDTLTNYQRIQRAEHDAKKQILTLLLEQIDTMERERTVIVGKLEKMTNQNSEMRNLMLANIKQEKRSDIQTQDNVFLVRKLIELQQSEVKSMEDTIQSLSGDKQHMHKQIEDQNAQIEVLSKQYTDSLVLVNRIVGAENEDLITGANFIANEIIPHYEGQVNQLTSQLRSLQAKNKELEEKYYQIGESIQSFEEERQKKAANLETTEERLRKYKLSIQQGLLTILSRIPGEHDQIRIDEYISRAPKDVDDYISNFLMENIMQKCNATFRKLNQEIEMHHQNKAMEQEKLNRLYDSVLKMGSNDPTAPVTRSFQMPGTRDYTPNATPDILSSRLRDLDSQLSRREDIIKQLDQKLMQSEEEINVLQQELAKYVALEEEYRAFQNHTKEMESAIRVRDEQIDILSRKLSQLEEDNVLTVQFIENLSVQMLASREQFERNDRQIEILIDRIKELEGQKKAKTEMLRRLQQEQEASFGTNPRPHTMEYVAPLTNSPEDIELSELFNSARQTLRAIGEKTAGQDATLMNREMLERLYDEEIQVTAGEILMREEQLGLLVDKLGVAEVVFGDLIDKLGQFSHNMRLSSSPTGRLMLDPQYRDLMRSKQWYGESQGGGPQSLPPSAAPMALPRVYAPTIGAFTSQVLQIPASNGMNPPPSNRSYQIPPSSTLSAREQPPTYTQSARSWAPQSTTRTEQPEPEEELPPQRSIYSSAGSNHLTPRRRPSAMPMPTDLPTIQESGSIHSRGGNSGRKQSVGSFAYRSLPNIDPTSMIRSTDTNSSTRQRSPTTDSSRRMAKEDDYDEITNHSSTQMHEPEELTLLVDGEPVEGNHLLAIGSIVDKYASAAVFSWSKRIANRGEFTDIPGAKRPEFELTQSDIGYEFKCTCEARDNKGDVITASSTSAPIIMSIPRILEIEVHGGPYHTQQLAVRAKYIGGREGRSDIQWFRSVNGEPYVAILGANNRTYQPSVDDMHTSLRVDYTPVRSDGMKGETASCVVPTSYLTADPNIRKAVEQNVRQSEATFEVATKGHGGVPEGRILVCSNTGVKIRKGTKTKGKYDYGRQFRVRLPVENTTLLFMDVDQTTSLEIFTQDSKTRDILALTLRSFNGIAMGSKLRAVSN